MYDRMNEDIAWQRLQDLQREMENSRLFAEHGMPRAIRLLRLLGERMWWLAGLAFQRPPRRHPAAGADEPGAARHAA